MGGVVRELADVAVITSDNPRTEDPWAIIQDVLTGMAAPAGEVHVEPDRRQAIRWALAQGRSGDVIVLAGKGHETVQEVQGVTLLWMSGKSWRNTLKNGRSAGKGLEICPPV